MPAPRRDGLGGGGGRPARQGWEGAAVEGARTEGAGAGAVRGGGGGGARGDGAALRKLDRTPEAGSWIGHHVQDRTVNNPVASFP